MNPENQPATPAVAPKKVGPIVTVLVIVLILIIGALYLFASRLNQNGDVSDTMTDSDYATSAPTVQPVTNQSDDVNSMNADLNASTKGLDNQNF